MCFESAKYEHIAITFHSSKGLEFDQVIVFAEDYRLSDMPSLYNHYVAVTRAKSKLIIVKVNNYNANCFQTNLARVLSESGLAINDIVSYQ
jgi:ATP-dependent exoDNAse (exonuclease V) beta subunit